MARMARKRVRINRLREVLQELNLTQNELVGLGGFSFSLVNNVYNRCYYPTPKTRHKLVAAIGQLTNTSVTEEEIWPIAESMLESISFPL